MDISNIVDITISVAAPTVSRIGFGTPAIYAYNIIPVASVPVVQYSTSTWSVDLLADGYNVDDPVYLCAQAIASQEPRPRTFKVIRGAQTFSFDTDMVPLTFATGETITVTLTGEDPAVANTLISQTYTRACGGGSIGAECTAVAALIQAGLWGAAGDITAAKGVGDTIEIRAQAPYANQMLYYSGVNNLSIADVTALRTVATDLDTAIAFDPDWYMLLCPDCGTLDSIAIATWMSSQTNKKAALQTQDTTVVSAGTGIANTLRLANRSDTGIIYSENSLAENPAAAWAGRHLPETPGTEVWAFKALTGVTPSTLTAAQAAFAHADFCNTYEGVTVGSQTIVSGIGYKGWVSALSESYMDRQRLIDALVAEVQANLVNLFSASRKVPYNDSGIGQVKAALLAAIHTFEGDNAGFVPGSAFCDVPLRADVSAADLAARELNNVTFGADLNGAIMKVTISATLSF
jgi:hypothetical protein